MSTVFRFYSIFRYYYYFTSTCDMRQRYKCNFQASPCWLSRWFVSTGLTARGCFYALTENEPPLDQHNQTSFSSLKYDAINHPGFFCFAWCSEYELLALNVFGRLLKVSGAALSGTKGQSPAGGKWRCWTGMWHSWIPARQVNSVESCHTNTQAPGTRGECLIGDKETGLGFSGCFL